MLMSYPRSLSPPLLAPKLSAGDLLLARSSLKDSAAVGRRVEA